MLTRALTDAVGRVDAAYGPDGWGYGIANTAIMFGVIIGGLVGIFILRTLALKFWHWKFGFGCSKKWVNAGKNANGKTLYVLQDHPAGNAVSNVLFELFFLICGVAVIWFGYFSAGFNFLHSPYIGVSLSIIGTYAFGVALQNLSGKLFNNAENIFPLGTYIRIPQLGPDIHGFIIDQTAFHVILQRKDAYGGRCKIKVPASDFFARTVFEDSHMQNDKEQWVALEIDDTVLAKLTPGTFETLEKPFVDACGFRDEKKIGSNYLLPLFHPPSSTGDPLKRN